MTNYIYLSHLITIHQAIERSRNFVNTITNKTALEEILRLHIVEQEITTDEIINNTYTTVSPKFVLP
jgi:hypothetical protein